MLHFFTFNKEYCFILCCSCVCIKEQARVRSLDDPLDLNAQVCATWLFNGSAFHSLQAYFQINELISKLCNSEPSELLKNWHENLVDPVVTSQ